jgi:hypothetical protein
MPRKFYVNIYLIDRACGGSEEGGWWYNYGECYGTIPAKSRSQANNIVKKLTKRRYSNEGRRPISSVNSRGQYEVLVETKKGEDWSDYQPWE